jgi:glycosyltransferase involved in cell wall biosynthesis
MLPDRPTRAAVSGPRVVHVVQSMKMGGIETLVLDLIKVRSSGFGACIALEGARGELLEQWTALAALGERFQCIEKAPGKDLMVLPRLVRALRALRPDAVVVHHIGPLLYGGTAARILRVPCLIHYEHDIWHYADSKHRRLVAVCARFMHAHHFAVSEEVATKLRTIVGTRPIRVVAPGIDADQFVIADRTAARDRLGLDPEAHWIGTVGRLVPVKDQASLIVSMSKLDQRCRLAIVGDGPERLPLERLASDVAPDGRVVFLGQRDDICKILPALDVFCLSSRNEGLPRSILEAQACGIPVVATDVGAVSSAVCKLTGAIVPPGDPSALAVALARVIANRPSPEITRSHVVEHFSIANVDHEIRQLALASHRSK